MNILGINGGHDGSVVYFSEGKLIYAQEAEKSSFPRHSRFGADTMLTALEHVPEVPDVLAHSGWWKGNGSATFPTGVGYYGLDRPFARKIGVFGRSTLLIETTHERSHLWCSLGLSNIDPDADCQALLWEGDLGRIYRIRAGCDIELVRTVLPEPGSRYVFPYALANGSLNDDTDPALLLENAGKLMALAAFEEHRIDPDLSERNLLDKIMGSESVYPLRKGSFRSSHLYNAGVESVELKRFARLLSDAIFDKFWFAIETEFDKTVPLVLAGGCGLNCEWNTRIAQQWKAEVFVPPCPNDSGVAMGAAIDAQQALGGPRRLEWRIDCGATFVADTAPSSHWKKVGRGSTRIASIVHRGGIIAWICGRCELGPRALGFRSIIGSPFKAETRTRLNTIKNREQFRPIAPVCQVEHAGNYFEGREESPYMLYFHKVRSPSLTAVTHVDGTARAQTVSRQQNVLLWDLLEECRKLTGYGVLCNTSLNWSGLGFINSMSELDPFASKCGLDGFVVDGELWLHEDWII